MEFVPLHPVNAQLDWYLGSLSRDECPERFWGLVHCPPGRMPLLCIGVLCVQQCQDEWVRIKLTSA